MTPAANRKMLVVAGTCASLVFHRADMVLVRCRRPKFESCCFSTNHLRTAQTHATTVLGFLLYFWLYSVCALHGPCTISLVVSWLAIQFSFSTAFVSVVAGMPVVAMILSIYQQLQPQITLFFKQRSASTMKFVQPQN